MGRTVVIDDAPLSGINGLLSSSNRFQVGLLLGQKDYLIALIPTPQQEDSQEDKLEVDWIQAHATQVNRMLSGGIQIIGIYVLCANEFFSKSSASFFSILKSLRSITDYRTSTSSIYHLLHLSTTTKKYVCKNYDVSDPTASQKPSEVKITPFINSFITLNTTYNVHFELHLQDKTRSLQQQIQEQLKEVTQDIKSALTLIDSKVINTTDTDDELTIDKFLPKKKKTGGEVSVEFLSKVSSAAFKNGQKIQGCVRLYGTVHAIAFLHPKEPLSVALKALRADVLNTLSNRFYLLFEEADRRAEELNEPNLLNNNITAISKDTHWLLPKRVFIPLVHAIHLSDYLFPYESLQDCAERCKEMLSLSAPNDKSEAEWLSAAEEFPAEQALKSLLAPLHTTNKQDSPAAAVKTQSEQKVPPKESTAAGPNMTVIVAILVLIIALIAYSYLQK